MEQSERRALLALDTRDLQRDAWRLWRGYFVRAKGRKPDAHLSDGPTMARLVARALHKARGGYGEAIRHLAWGFQQFIGDPTQGAACFLRCLPAVREVYGSPPPDFRGPPRLVATEAERGVERRLQGLTDRSVHDHREIARVAKLDGPNPVDPRRDLHLQAQLDHPPLDVSDGRRKFTHPPDPTTLDRIAKLFGQLDELDRKRRDP